MRAVLLFVLVSTVVVNVCAGQEIETTSSARGHVDDQWLERVVDYSDYVFWGRVVEVDIHCREGGGPSSYAVLTVAPTSELLGGWDGGLVKLHIQNYGKKGCRVYRDSLHPEMEVGGEYLFVGVYFPKWTSKSGADLHVREGGVLQRCVGGARLAGCSKTESGDVVLGYIAEIRERIRNAKIEVVAEVLQLESGLYVGHTKDNKEIQFHYWARHGEPGEYPVFNSDMSYAVVLGVNNELIHGRYGVMDYEEGGYLSRGVVRYDY
jgi:hypothetical protein